MVSRLFLLSLILITGCAANSVLHEALDESIAAPSGIWNIEVQNLSMDTITSMRIRFSSDPATDSCLGGNWKRVILESFITSDEEFFPVNDPLSYDYDGHKLVIGRNVVCDGYLHLDGTLDGNSAKGDFVQFGWGFEKLGQFTAARSEGS